MTIFYLPDLGEGLPEAEINEWFIKEGDTVKKDQPLVAMETAKAVVDVPAPQDGTITKLYGQVGAIIKTGKPLVEFNHASSSIVGQLEEHPDIALQHINLTNRQPELPKATFTVKKLALEYNVNLNDIVGSGQFGVITANDVLSHAKKTDCSRETLIGVRRQMMKTMQLSHQEIVPVSIFDEADINHWQKPYDITVRLIQAICYACKQEPGLNAWFKHEEKQIFNHVNLGLAVDSNEGLFVPVIKNANHLDALRLRQAINSSKQGVLERSLPPENFKDATIILSNFGRFAGKFANPIIVPPMVAIIAVGRVFDAVVAYQGEIAVHTKVPISLTFDHRPLTGGEATRFLKALIEHLEQ